MRIVSVSMCNVYELVLGCVCMRDGKTEGKINNSTVYEGCRAVFHAIVEGGDQLTVDNSSAYLHIHEAWNEVTTDVARLRRSRRYCLGRIAGNVRLTFAVSVSGRLSDYSQAPMQLALTSKF